MNQTQITTTASSIPATIAAILICLLAWHWLESGAGFGTGVGMTVQDVKVTFSCRNFDTITRFISRRHEDYLLDKQAFAYPSWKYLICPVYAQESLRTEGDRSIILARAWARVPDITKTRISQWAEDQGDPYNKLWGVELH